MHRHAVIGLTAPFSVFLDRPRPNRFNRGFGGFGGFDRFDRFDGISRIDGIYGIGSDRQPPQPL